MGNWSGANMRCPKCNKYLPDRCICNGPSIEDRRTAPVSAPMDDQKPKSAFRQHLADCSKIVDGWPAWKKGLWAPEGAAPMGQELPPPELTWLYSHCKAIGMYCKSDSGKWEQDIALWTIQQAERIRQLERELAERKTASIDTPEFRALLSRVQGWKDGNALIDGPARALIDYIDGHTAGTAPEGWKLVPVELTDDMIVAFAEQWYSKARCIDDCEMEDCYAAMIAAAPTPMNSGKEEAK